MNLVKGPGFQVAWVGGLGKGDLRPLKEGVSRLRITWPRFTPVPGRNARPQHVWTVLEGFPRMGSAHGDCPRCVLVCGFSHTHLISNRLAFICLHLECEYGLFLLRASVHSFTKRKYKHGESYMNTVVDHMRGTWSLAIFNHSRGTKYTY